MGDGSLMHYKVMLYKESLMGSLLFGQSNVDPENLTEFLNRQARDGWRVIHVERDQRRELLFWNRDAYMIFFERD